MLALEFLPWIPDDQLAGALALAAALEVNGLMDRDEARQLRVAIYRKFTARLELVTPRRSCRDGHVGPELIAEMPPILDPA